MAIILCFLLCMSTQGSELEFNTPAEVRSFFKANPELARYEISPRINPFYLRGDFDGDANFDLAVLVVERKTKRRGILVIHPKKAAYFVVGAGQDFMRSDGVNLADFDFEAWSIYSKRDVGQSLQEQGPPPKLLGEAILAEWPEAASGIIFWNGKTYQWYHLGG